MTTSDFSTTILVDQTPSEVFKAINNVRGWWSEEIDGPTFQLNDEFYYHHKDSHRCKMKLIEVIPNQKVVWLVMENYFNFTKDKSEWIGTKISFEISKAGNQTQLRFTHIGLVPEYECFLVCQNAWSNYINNSLRSLITTGKGNPNPKEGGFNDAIIEKFNLGKKKSKAGQDFTTHILVDQTAHESFNAIRNVRGWWTENMEGKSHDLKDEFTVRFGDVHVSTQRLIEIIPDKKIVWLVTDSALNFVEDKKEWTGTRINFEIAAKGNKTEIRFSHLGLVPEYECFSSCSNAWSEYIHESLFYLITTGHGQPTAMESEIAVGQK